MAKTRTHPSWRNKESEKNSPRVDKIESEHDGQVVVITVHNEVTKLVEVLYLGDNVKVCDTE